MLFNSSVHQSRQVRLQGAWGSMLKKDDLVLVHSGHPLVKPGGLDQTYDFLPHPSYFWLTGHRRPQGVVAFSLDSGWREYQRPLSPVDIVWEGDEHNFHCDHSLKDLKQVLTSGKFRRVLHLGAPGLEWKNQDGELALGLSIVLDQTRRHKDSAEVELIEKIAGFAGVGYNKLKSEIKSGISERELQIHYESAVLMAGAEKMPYGSIVGSGENSAILHAVPSSKKLNSGDLVLVDAGADLQDYCVDITRVFAVDENFSSRQQEIYDIVLQAQTECIEMCRPQTQWRDVHMHSARVIAEGLSQFKIWQGSVDAALESGAISVFYPHGVGHLVGLKVRDTGCPENLNPQRYYGARLRVDLMLKENYLLTVEPGCYFPRAFIESQEYREKYKDIINWQEADKWKDFGGIRIEDDILITAQGPRNLTACVPK